MCGLHLGNDRPQLGSPCPLGLSCVRGPRPGRQREPLVWLFTWRRGAGSGVELASASRRDARAAFLEQVLRLIPVESYDVAVAQVHGSLLAVVHRDDAQRGAHDLIIAATAAATKRTVVTLDRGARFGNLPGVDCLVLS